MRFLRRAHSLPTSLPPESDCLASFERELDYIFATLYRLGARRHEVEDLAQEIFLVLQKNWPRVDQSRPLRPYLFGIAFRIYRAQRRRQLREISPASVDFEEDGAPDPEAVLERKQSISLFQAALARVPLRRRAVIIMHGIDEVPIVEVARRLSMSEFGTYARWRKGRKELLAAVRRLVKGYPA